MRISFETMEQETRALLRNWTSAPLVDVRRPNLGTLNDVRSVTTPEDRMSQPNDNTT